jgi:hypothetical protein
VRVHGSVTKHERNGEVRTFRNAELELGAVELDTSCLDTVRRAAILPCRVVEAGKMPSLTLSVEASLVQRSPSAINVLETVSC